MKLWQKDNLTTSERVISFTVGEDRVFDALLARHDVVGSIAHAAMLQKVGVLSAGEGEMLIEALNGILAEMDGGTFLLSDAYEDVHSQVEAMLVDRLGDAGKKIHTGRSRNDQVAVDIKLYLKEELQHTRDAIQVLFARLLELSDKYKSVMMPGYTHMQVAMPSSFGLWLGAYAESLTDDMELLIAAWNVVNRNPLGSGAGYGSSFPLDRSETTRSLGFAEMAYNSIYAQMARGKGERIVAGAMASVAATLARLSGDICLYAGQNFGFLHFPDHLTTGSSIMPHKKNPDVFELVRAKCNRLQALPNEFALLMTNLPSGYHRDMQLTKEMLFPAIETLKSCLAISADMLQEMVVRENILEEDVYKYIFTVEKVNELVNDGTPFRDAYRQVGDSVADGTFAYDGTVNHSHEGSIGNLCNWAIRDRMERLITKMN